MKFQFKACPRCGGDLHLESDMYGAYAQCLQCGYMGDQQQEQVTAQVAAIPKRSKRSTEAAA